MLLQLVSFVFASLERCCASLEELIAQQEYKKEGVISHNAH
jgi:hypothetical protein